MTHSSRERLLRNLRQLQSRRHRQDTRQHEPNRKYAPCSSSNSSSSSGGGGGGGGGGSATFRRRTQQMIQRHLSARRASNRSELQSNLYQMLNSHKPHAAAAAAPATVTKTRAHNNALRGAHPGQERRRQHLLKAIEMLNRMTPDQESGSREDVETIACSSNSAADIGATATSADSRSQSEATAHDSSADGGAGGGGTGIPNELRRLNDSLCYLALACRTQLPQRGGEAAGAEVARKVGKMRGLVSGMLTRSARCPGVGAGGGDANARAGAAPPPPPHFRSGRPDAKSAGRRGDPLFWRCPAHEALAKQRLRCPGASEPAERRSVSARSAKQIAAERAKAALLGDPVFFVGPKGKEQKWGQMTVPRTQQRVPNSADLLGRENVLRRRLQQRREAALTQLEEFAGRVEAKWEEIEEARIDRAIDAACDGLRRAIASSKRKHKRRLPQRRHGLRSCKSSGPAPAETKSDTGRHPSDNSSLHWGI